MRIYFALFIIVNFFYDLDLKNICKQPKQMNVLTKSLKRREKQTELITATMEMHVN